MLIKLRCSICIKFNLKFIYELKENKQIIFKLKPLDKYYQFFK